MDNVFFVPEEARWNNIASNAHTPETIEIEAVKEWDDNDNQDGKREDVTLVLSGSYEDAEGTQIWDDF